MKLNNNNISICALVFVIMIYRRYLTGLNGKDHSVSFILTDEGILRLSFIGKIGKRNMRCISIRL